MRELSEMVRGCEAGVAERAPWELLVMLLVRERGGTNAPLTCDGACDERGSSVASSSSSSRAVMRILVIGRLTTVRCRGRLGKVATVGGSADRVSSRSTERRFEAAASGETSKRNSFAQSSSV